MSEFPIESVLTTSLFILLVAAALTLWRVIQGPSLADRVVALDLIGMILVGAMMLTAFLWRQAVYLDAVIAFVMVAFLATVGIARYLESGGRS